MHKNTPYINEKTPDTNTPSNTNPEILAMSLL